MPRLSKTSPALPMEEMKNPVQHGENPVKISRFEPRENRSGQEANADIKAVVLACQMQTEIHRTEKVIQRVAHQPVEAGPP